MSTCGYGLGQNVVVMLRFRCLTVFALLLIAASFQTQGRAADPMLRSSARLSNQDVLQLFCAEGRLIDRGVTNSPFAGPADGWILNLVAVDLNFGRALGVTKEQLAHVARDTDQLGDGEASAPHFGVMTEFEKVSTDGTEFAARLERILTPEQRKKLPAIHLALEGLMALRRAEFAPLIGISLEQQSNVAKSVDQCWDLQASPLHRRIFSATASELAQLAEFNLALRSVSADLDKKLLDGLTDQQREKLAPIVREAYELQKLVSGPGCR